MSKFLKLVLAIVLFGCNTNDSKVENEISDLDWNIEKTNSLEFKYPQKWKLKKKSEMGTTQFGFIDKKDNEGIFFPIEIWEFKPNQVTFKDFTTYVPNEYFVKATDGKHANRIDTDTIKFKNYEAIKFEYIKNSLPVEIYAVNGIKNYYLFVFYDLDNIYNLKPIVLNSIKLL